ncbi:hypothetical protein Haur_1325 [Herpetosiphon aurantiacus DSM 785]|uniref:Uncharacterized protein n=1 Tax=Herpetosiphon aurantiacus (strain ATCC 23779 / DSM 785 / 114-95) TaxID=316274 RepID=A9B2C5_HERA2|nr:hypothetical protein Haur_1325 [Herpetosiphon aurantiacus DSM 785]
MQAFDIANAGNFLDGGMNAVRIAMNAAKAGKTYACIQYFHNETVTYCIPESSESVEHLIALVDTMVVADPGIKTAMVMNPQSHMLWMVDRNTHHGYLMEESILQLCAGYICWECGHGQATPFNRCLMCTMDNTCQPSPLRWVHTYRDDRAAFQ